MAEIAANSQPRLIIDRDAREVTLDGVLVELTRIEYEMLAKLADHPRTVITNEQLSRSVLGSDWYTGPHSIAVHIGHIRQKLGEDGERPGFIVNKRGVGYMFDPLNGEGHQETTTATAVTLAYDHEMTLISVEPADEFFGWDPQQVVGTKFLLAIDEVAVNGGSDALLESLLASGVREFSVDSNIRCGDGSVTRARMAAQLQFDAYGNFSGLVGRVTGLAH